METLTDRGQIIIEALWISLVLFSLLLFLTYFSSKVEEEHRKNQFHIWDKR